MNSIQKRIKLIEDYKNDNKKSRELIKSALENDDKYQEVVKTAKEAADIKKRMKNEITSSPENEKLCWQIKENKEEIKILEEILATELMEYYRKTQTNEIEDAEGERRKFQITIKLSPSKKLME